LKLTARQVETAKPKEKLLAICVYPDVSLAEARSKREDAKRTLAAGNDPLLERKIEKLSRQQDAENSFEAITWEWYQRRYDRWSEKVRKVRQRCGEV